MSLEEKQTMFESLESKLHLSQPQLHNVEEELAKIENIHMSNVDGKGVKNDSEKMCSDEVDVDMMEGINLIKMRELLDAEIMLEKQFEKVRLQLSFLKQLPLEIDKHLKFVMDQLHKIIELSKIEVLANEQSSIQSKSKN